MKYLFLSLLLLASCSKKNELPAQKPVIAPTASQKEPEQASEIRLMGQVYSPGKMLLSFQTAGTIKALVAKPGMSFKKGQLLAELDARDISLRAETAQLRFEQALNQKKMAERDFHIEQDLYGKQISSKVQFENLKTNFDNANLAAKMAELDLRIAQKALADTKLLAPFDCMITKQFKVLGESSMGGSEGNAAYEIFETTALEIRLEAPENLLGRVQIGDSIEIEFPALKIKLPAKITRFVPVISERTRNFTLVALLDKPDPRIVPGYFVEGILK